MRYETFQKSYAELTARLFDKDNEDLTRLMGETFSLKGSEDERFSLEQLTALAGLIKELVKSEDKFTLNLGSTEITDDTITVLLAISDKIAVVKVLRELTEEESSKLRHNLPSLTFEEVISTDKPITITAGKERWTFNSSHVLKAEAPKVSATQRRKVLDSLKDAYRTFIELVLQNEKLAKEIKSHTVECEKAFSNSKTKEQKKKALMQASAIISHFNQSITGLQINLSFEGATPEILLKVLEHCSTELQTDANEYKLWRDQFLIEHEKVMQSGADNDTQIPEVLCHNIDKLILMLLDYISVNENTTMIELVTANNSLMKKEQETLRNTAKALTTAAISPAFHLVKELINPSGMNFFNQESASGGMNMTVSWKRILLIALEVVDFAPNDKPDTVRNLLREIEAFLSLLEQLYKDQTNSFSKALNSYTSINRIYNPLYSSAFKIIGYLNVLGLTDRCFKEKSKLSQDDNPRRKSLDQDSTNPEHIDSVNKIFDRMVRLLKNNKQISDLNHLVDLELRPMMATLRNKVDRQQTSDSSVDRSNGFFASADTPADKQAKNVTHPFKVPGKEM